MGFPAGQLGSLPPGWLRGRGWQSSAFHSFRISLSGALVFLWWHTGKHLPWRLPQKLPQASGLSQADADATGSSLCKWRHARHARIWEWNSRQHPGLRLTTASTECLTAKGGVLEAREENSVLTDTLSAPVVYTLQLYTLVRKRGRGIKDFNPTPTAVSDTET